MNSVSFGNSYSVASQDAKVIKMLANESNNLGDNVHFISNELDYVGARPVNGGRYYTGVLADGGDGKLAKAMEQAAMSVSAFKNDSEYFAVDKIVSPARHNVIDTLKQFAEKNQTIIVNSIEELRQHPVLKNIIKNIENIGF